MVGDPSTITRALVRELPDAFRPDWGARAWAGTFGSQGLRSVVTGIDSTLTLSASGVTGTSSVTGRVLGRPGSWLERLRSFVTGADDATRGRFAHTLRLHDSGRLEAHHTLLKLDRGSRGTGFATGFVERGRSQYGAVGVDDVTMFAGMSVGGYAWAREGLDFATNEVDELARAIDRGRQVAAVVDGARGWVDLSGRIPRLGRRITQAQYDQIAPRLVRGSELPPNAITSMQQLADVPQIGRSVLLGHVWKGTASIERSAPWWARNGAHTTAQAADAMSYRFAPELVATESVAAARRIASTMPAAVDPFRASETFARHLAAAGVGGVDDAAQGARAVVRVALDRPVPTVEASIPLRTARGGSAALRVTWDGTELRAVERISPRHWRDAGLRQALDSAWRELGVDRVRSGVSGLRRNVPSG